MSIATSNTVFTKSESGQKLYGLADNSVIEAIDLGEREIDISGRYLELCDVAQPQGTDFTIELTEKRRVVAIEGQARHVYRQDGAIEAKVASRTR